MAAQFGVHETYTDDQARNNTTHMDSQPYLSHDNVGDLETSGNVDSPAQIHSLNNTGSGFPPKPSTVVNSSKVNRAVFKKVHTDTVE